MFKKTFVLAALLAGTLVAVPSTAAATEATFIPAGEIAFRSEGPLTFTGIRESSEEVEASFRCNVTMAGTLERGPIPIERAEAVGAIRALEWSNCSGEGELGAALSLSWRFGTRFLSRFPFIGILIGFFGNVEVNLHIAFIRIRCLYAGTTGLLAGFSGGAPPFGIGPLSWLAALIRVSGGFPCPSKMGIGGEMVMTPATRVNVE